MNRRKRRSRRGGILHPNFTKADSWSKRAIGAAIEVHRLKGPGLIESIYEKCLMRELQLQAIPATNQLIVPIEYKGISFEETLKPDVFIDGCLVLELKAVAEVHPVHKAQLLSYMRLLNAPIGLIINFHEPKLIDDISRMILPGANSE